MERVPAVGGVRTVPAPDPVARDYLRLALGLDQHQPGLVEAYFGPADLKAVADMESLRAPARLAEDAVALRDRLPGEVRDPGRREWFRAQLVALEAHARILGGETIPYEILVEHCFDQAMPRIDDARFETAAAELDALLPGDAPLVDRLTAWDTPLTIDEERVPSVAHHLASIFRARAANLFGLPEGEDVLISMVRDRPWSGANWYDGGRRSRVELNLDLPVRVGDLVRLVAHETYFGHHLEAATKEARLVDGEGRAELTLLSINTPECLLHEGLAELGYEFAVPSADQGPFLAELFRVAGLPVAADPGAARAVADTEVRVGRAREVLRGIGGNAALLRHEDRWSRQEVIDYVITVGRQTPARAEQLLDSYIEHPFWRTYIFVYREGAQLLGDWLELAAESERVERFGRLLAEARSPSSIAAERGVAKVKAS
ncbi:MAG TPA: hypothetical protein VLS28_07675 [Candidatus Sulfomarinibacteraceae bacterium]|nr:hypothetical protein [Candidatus Sulfomarinibacteraceae bacterium]